MRMSQMNEHQNGVITGIDASCIVCRRLLDLGFSAGENVECMIKGTYGSPIAYKIGGTTIALRKIDAEKVGVVL